MRILRKAGKFARKKERKGLWRGVVTGIAAVVVFCTTYALILPAITMETEGFSCGMAEHSHTQECYQLICGQQEYFSHSHVDECYEGGQLTCTLTERTCHHHSADCYSKAQPACGQEELPAHSHGDGCYETRSVLTCGMEEYPAHSHGEECYVEGELTCTLAETQGHTHGEECYGEQKTLICGKEETPGHSHTAECYPADFQPELICGQEDIPEHRHSEACYARICEMEEHIHTELCVDSHEAFLENQEEILNDVTEPSNPPAQTTEPAETETQENTICWDDPEAAAEAGYFPVCTSTEEGHVHTRDCYVSADELEQFSQGAQYALARIAPAESGVMLLAEGDSGVLPVGDNITASNTVYQPSSGTFKTDVKIHYSFEGVSGQKAVEAGKSYFYNYPAGVDIPSSLLDKSDFLLDDAGRAAGTYTFRKNADNTYSVEVVFSSAYVNGLLLGEPVSGSITYSGEFSESRLQGKNFVLDNGSSTVPILGDITYPRDETESFNIDVSKSGSLSAQGDALEYTVFVRSTKGTPGDISFNDIMTTPSGITLGDPTVKVEKGTTLYYQNWDNSWSPYDNNDWTTVDGAAPSIIDGKLSMSLEQLSAQKTTDTNGSPCITANTYKITYSYPIIDQTVASVSPQNNATVRSTNNEQTVEKSDGSEVTINKDLSYTLDKGGEMASDKPGYIRWVITVNKNNQNIAGAQLTDSMLGLVENAQDITVSPEAGASVNNGSNGKISNITFQETDNGVNKGTYTVTYYTPAAETWDGTTVSNQATLDPDPDNTGDEKIVMAAVTVNGVQLSKDGSHNAATDKLDWIITVNAGKLNIAGANLTDDMFSALTGTDFTVTSSDGTNSGYQFVYGENGTTIIGITFPAQSDGKNTQTYTIRYTTDIPANSNGTTVTSVLNKALLTPASPNIGQPIEKEKTITLEDPELSKSGYYDQSAQRIYWTVTVNANERDIAGAVLQDSMMNRLESLEVKDKNGNVISEDAGHYIVGRDENGKITSITFRTIGETGANLNKYTVTYFTEELQQWSNRTVENNASLNGKALDEPAKVEVPGSGYVEKSAGSATVSEDGKQLIIPWTVILNVPKGGLPLESIVIDDVTKNQYGNTNTDQWISSQQAGALEQAGMVWKDYNGNEQQVAFGENQITFTGSEDRYTGFSIAFPSGLVPPEGYSRLTITYSTTASLERASVGQNKFLNYVNASGRENSAEYIHYNPGVLKTDGSGSTEKTTVSNEGSLTWIVKAYAAQNNKKLTLVDTLPAGVNLESLQLTGWSNLNVQLIVAEDGSISGSDSTNQYVFDGSSYQDGVITLNITPSGSDNTIPSGAEFTLTVDCSVTDAANKTGSTEFTNSVEMTLDDGDGITASQTQEWTYQKAKVDIVSKKGEWFNNSRLLSYSVILNPDGDNLVEEADVLNLTDVLKYNKTVESWHLETYERKNATVTISLIQGSVKLYNNNTGEEITDWIWQYSSKPNPDWTNQIINTITATVPDSTPLKLEYHYSVSSDTDKGFAFYLDPKNTAELSGHSSGETALASEKQWSDASSSGNVTSTSALTITKVDAGNYGNVLAGTEFSVYAYDMAAGVRGTSPIRVLTTDENGVITITQGKAEQSEFVYQTDVLYVVVETKAPNGYLLPDNPEEFYFYFSGETETTGTKPTDIASNAVDLSKMASTAIVKNTAVPTTSVTVEKQWLDKNGNPKSMTSGSIQFDLYQIASATPPSGSSGGGSTSGSVAWILTGNRSNESPKTGTLSGVSVGDKIKLSLNMNYSGSGWMTITWDGVSDGSGSWNGNSYEYTCTVTSGTISIVVNDTVGCLDTITANVIVYADTGTTDPDPGGSTSGTGGTPYGQTPYTITAADGWTTTISGLPISGVDGNGDTVYYSYYLEEHSGNYTTAYENNGGIGSGTIVIKNTLIETPSYTLPNTGGIGWEGYTVTGLVTSIGAVLGLMKKRKKGERR